MINEIIEAEYNKKRGRRMSDRMAKLEKALAFDGTRVKKLADECDAEAFWDVPSFLTGAKEESMRLAPLHAALIDAVEALELQADCDDDGAGGFYTDAANKALSKIDKALMAVAASHEFNPTDRRIQIARAALIKSGKVKV